jgi:SAM-dependent methyltransferase
MKASEKMFEEAYRILRPGGFFRVTTPNAPMFWNSFIEDDKSLWLYTFDGHEVFRRLHTIKEALVDYFASQLSIDEEELKRVVADPRSEGTMEEVLDFYISLCTDERQRINPGGHMNWWSAEKLINLMDKVGFNNCYESQYGQSRCPVMRNVTYFDNTHPHISVFVEAQK